LKFYADVHRTKKNGEGFRITYTTDGTTFKHIDSFSEIPARPGDKLFMDTLPPQYRRRDRTTKAGSRGLLSQETHIT